MAVLIDPPLWPAHGTVFSHLVSDRDLTELHALAAAAGISPRAFDRDHYDVPAHRRQELIQMGARPVSAAELTRRLRASGLRIPARERPERIRAGLLRAWDRAFPAWAGHGGALLARWEEEHRAYHDSVHLREVLERLDGPLAPEREKDRTVLALAAWYHDAVYRGRPGADEEDSAALLEEEARHLPAGAGAPSSETVRRAAALVRATAAHARSAEADPLWPALHDADLGILAADPGRYRRYVEGVRREYAHVPEGQFRARRAMILRELIGGPRVFLTPAGRARWEEAARANVNRELAELEGGSAPEAQRPRRR
ncbi:DUF4031 domain-containing protein [Rothia kristinae]